MADELNGTNGSDPGKMYRLIEQRKKYKGEAEAKTRELADAHTELNRLRGQVAEYEKNPSNQRVADLEKALRSRDWRDKFNEVATEKYRAKKNALDILWKQSGLEIDGDEPNLIAIETALKGHAKALDFAFDPEPSPTGEEGAEEGAEVEEAVEPPPVGGRGSASTKGGVPSISQAQANDPEWRMRHWKQVAAASKAGTIRKK